LLARHTVPPTTRNRHAASSRQQLPHQNHIQPLRVRKRKPDRRNVPRPHQRSIESAWKVPGRRPETQQKKPQQRHFVDTTRLGTRRHRRRHPQKKRYRCHLYLIGAGQGQSKPRKRQQRRRRQTPRTPRTSQKTVRRTRIHSQPTLPRPRRQQTRRPRTPTQRRHCKPRSRTQHTKQACQSPTQPPKSLEEDREVFYIVENGKAAKLQNIVEDPKNRRGNEYQDENGSYSYYTDEDGQAFTQFEQLGKAEYRVIEIDGEELEVHDQKVEPECPELDHNEREDLEEFCLYREDGFCNELEEPCVLTTSDD